MFDPFEDFDVNGYLRNVQKEKNLKVIKHLEHDIFITNLPEALEYIQKRNSILYKDFLKVHEILFSDFYPWAGKDRLDIAQNIAVSKADIFFCHPNDIRRAIDEGIRLAQLTDKMECKPGEIMGLFAYAHPFLDGNGRTMLIIHAELAHRAGYSIAWHKTNKNDYLMALSNEIKKPGDGILDEYLLRFKEGKIERNVWKLQILSVKGLDGTNDENKVEGYFSDSDVEKMYEEFNRSRNYSLTPSGYS